MMSRQPFYYSWNQLLLILFGFFQIFIVGMVSFLCDPKISYAFIQSESAFSAGDIFHEAIKNGEIDDVKKLLAGGFNPSQAFEDGITPLHLAVAHNQLEIAMLLLQNGANVKAKDATTNASPLHFAALYGRTNLAALLLENGAEVNDVMKFNITPLLVAAQFKQPELLELLIEYKANVNHVDEEGFTALHFAVQNNDEVSSKVLIQKGANVNALDKNNLTPLKIAEDKRALNIVNLLKEHGAKGKDE